MDGYAGIIDNKAYSKYTISNDHHNRMVHNHIEGFHKYCNSDKPLAFFSYIAGGFGTNIDGQLMKIINETGVCGSAVTVSHIIQMAENHQTVPHTNAQIKNIFHKSSTCDERYRIKEYKMDRELDELKYALENKRPILLVGAGFSKEARNNKNEEYGTGNTLSKILFDKICFPASHKFEEMPSENNLKDVCDFVCDLGKKAIQERDKIITEHFSGCVPATYHKYLTSYPWKYIFSLNVDSLIETLFRNSKIALTVWNGDQHGHHQDNSTTLVKLHGCINAKNHNYIFDSMEYSNFSISQSCLLRELGHQLTENDIILLGTEFQEEDIFNIINTYTSSGYDIKSKYFVVTPSISNEKLKRKLRSPGFYWIKQTTKDFLTYLTTIQINEDITEFMKEKGMIPINQQMKKTFYESELYHGKESRYADFWGDWDIIYPSTKNWEDKIEQASSKVLCAIIGNTYCGKTCVARRLAVDLNKKGYLCDIIPIE